MDPVVKGVAERGSERRWPGCYRMVCSAIAGPAGRNKERQKDFLDVSFVLSQTNMERVRETRKKDHLKGCWLKGHGGAAA